MNRDNKDLLIYYCRSVVCYLIPNARVYRAKKKVKKKSWNWFGNSFADLYVYTIVLFSKWGGLLRHRVVTTSGNFENGHQTSL